jgi:2-oxo-4-hydroxy-4-carboxy--5-ureidoimidazoline (OHCU) decarboxylase
VSNHFPIPSPPPELLQQWENQIFDEQENVDVLLIEAYKAGADQELEACCGELPGLANFLRAARRPKPPSLKEQALAALDDCTNRLDGAHENIIRRALEGLPND